MPQINTGLSVFLITLGFLRWLWDLQTQWDLTKAVKHMRSHLQAKLQSHMRSRHHQDWPATVQSDHGQDRSKPISRKWTKWVFTHKNPTIQLVGPVFKQYVILATRASEARFKGPKSSL